MRPVTKRGVPCELINTICNIFLCSICSFQFEADRRAIIITINSFGTELSKDDRAKLYPRCGKMNPDGLAALARADDYEQVKAVAEYYAEYAALFDGSGNNPGDKTLEDKFFEHEVSSRFHYMLANINAFYISSPKKKNHLPELCVPKPSIQNIFVFLTKFAQLT